MFDDFIDACKELGVCNNKREISSTCMSIKDWEALGAFAAPERARQEWFAEQRLGDYGVENRRIQRLIGLGLLTTRSDVIEAGVRSKMWELEEIGLTWLGILTLGKGHVECDCRREKRK